MGSMVKAGESSELVMFQEEFFDVGKRPRF
jgi:hypothetical protein